MPVTNHTIVVTVDSVDKTDYVLKDSLFIRMNLSKSNVAEVKFKDYNPTERSQIQITINGSIVFGGVITRKSATLIGVKGSASVIWSVECKDWNELLETIKVTEEYVEQSDSEIVAALFSTYLPSAGFTTSGLTTLDNDLDISFADVSMREALDQLASRVGANWYIKPSKAVYWFNPSTPETASFSISSSPNESTSFGFLNNSLSYEIDSSTIVNQVKIIGGVKSTGTKQTDNFTGTGSQKTFNLSKIPDSVLYCGYNDGYGNYTTYGSFIGNSPQDKLVSQGGNYSVIIDQANKTITIEGLGGNGPANGTTVTVVYYYKEIVDFTFNDTGSQSTFGTYPVSILNQTFKDEDEARQLANTLLEQNAYGKARISFDTAKYGLLPGQLLTIDITELGLSSALQSNVLLLENGDKLLLENGDLFLLEEFSLGQTFLVQEISLTPVVTAQDQFMLVCNVSAGRYAPTIIDSLATSANLQSSTGKASQTSIPVKLSNISSDLGEINLGRAAFTDGGTAQFAWSNPGGASGVVIGLEDTTSAYGALYIYDSGNTKAKLGRLDDLPLVGTIQPSGWGLFTENGYFSGVVSASQLIGGTVTGSLVQGGTITGNVITGGSISGNYISGGTIDGALVQGITIIGGTIATSTPPINSSNPGVILDSTGLYGYGSAGLTFRLSSDPAIKPWFSSGTILNTIYEVNESAVIRTGTTNPRIQIDNSGIFAYDSSGVSKFTVDAATGKMTAITGSFSGTVSATTINSSQINGAIILGGYIGGLVIEGGTVSGGTVMAGTLTGNVITSGTITGNYISAGTISGNQISGGTINGSQITGGTITAGLFSGGTVSGAVFTGGTVTQGTISAATINGGTITAGLFTGGTVNGGTVTGSYISAASGNVILDSNGMSISAPSSYTGNRAIKWNSSGTTYSSVSGYFGAGIATLDFISGISSTNEGRINFTTYNTTGNYSFFRMYPQSHEFWMNSSIELQLIPGTVVVHSNLAPNDTASNLQLGDSTHGFRYLYLKDDNGNVRRVSINTSGVLTVT